MTIFSKIKTKYSLEILPVYMMTRAEAMVTNTIVAIITALILSTVFFYFPKHLQHIFHRFYYYFTGSNGEPLSSY